MLVFYLISGPSPLSWVRQPKVLHNIKGLFLVDFIKYLVAVIVTRSRIRFIDLGVLSRLGNDCTVMSVSF